MRGLETEGFKDMGMVFDNGELLIGDNPRKREVVKDLRKSCCCGCIGYLDCQNKKGFAGNDGDKFSAWG